MRRLFFLTVVLLARTGTASTLGTYEKNQEGVQKFAAKSYYPAYQAFLKALEQDPLNPEIQLNLALTFEVNEEYEKAEMAYKGVLRLTPENSPRRFETLFNLGGVLGKQKKIDEALGAYQAALALQPESREVKTNIELLWQQGGGGGEGENKDKKDQQGDQKQQQKGGEGDKKDQKQNAQDQQQEQKEQKKQPKPFSSQELTAQDVKKILDEIKNQEQAIRAQEYERNVKEAPRGKDW